jgi:phosphatidylinositol glycan class K
MLADCTACDPRNPFPGQVLPSRSASNLHLSTTEIDYKDRDVSVESVMQVLTGHHPPGTPASRKLNTNANSTVLLYLTGHGGDGFLKFHDQTELLSTDLAAAIKSMHSAKRYKELLLVLDTCQAATLYSELDSVPNWAGIASSKLGQSSYALRSDPGVGAHLVDEFSHYLANYLDKIPIHDHTGSSNGSGSEQNKIKNDNSPSLEQMLASIRTNRMSSEIAVESSKLGRPLSAVKVVEFFGDSGRSSGSEEGFVVSGSSGGGGVEKIEDSISTSSRRVTDLEEASEQEKHAKNARGDSMALHDLLLQAWP